MWIETETADITEYEFNVTPHAGVWIETSLMAGCVRWLVVTPHAGVWIETIHD